MRRRVIGVDGVEVQIPIHPPNAIVLPPKQGPRNSRQRFERSVRKSGSAIWHILAGEGEETDRVFEALAILGDDDES